MPVIPTLNRKEAYEILGFEGFERYRNYEIETALIKKQGTDVIISEWCPFNGIFCKYFEIAPLEELRAVRRRFQKLDPLEYNVPYLLGIVDDQISVPRHIRNL